MPIYCVNISNIGCIQLATAKLAFSYQSSPSFNAFDNEIIEYVKELSGEVLKIN